MPKHNEYEGQSGGGADWLNLKDGDNKVRIVSSYETCGKHWVNDKPLICVGLDAGCAECATAQEYKEKMREIQEQFPEGVPEDNSEFKGLVKKYNKHRSKVQFFAWAIDRTDGKIKILKYGAMVQGQITELAKGEEYGFDEMPDYDMTINKSGTGLGTKYSVLAARKDTPLELEEKKAIEGLKPLADIITAMKNKVLKQMEEGTVPTSADNPEVKTETDAPANVAGVNENKKDDEEINVEDIPF